MRVSGIQFEGTFRECMQTPFQVDHEEENSQGKFMVEILVLTGIDR